MSASENGNPRFDTLVSTFGPSYVDPDAGTIVENRDLLTEARLNLTRALEEDTYYQSPLVAVAQAQATTAAATEARIRNKLAYIALFPDTPIAHRFRAEIEEAL